MDSEWLDKIEGTNCPLCKDPSHGCEMVLDGSVTRTYLQPSATFRGYCVLVLKRHAVELDDLTSEERAALIEDIARVGHAIRAVCAPAKLNYEILGNIVPHVHAHIIPRYVGDPAPGWPAWSALPDDDLLSEDEYSILAEKIRSALDEQNSSGPIA